MPSFVRRTLALASAALLVAPVGAAHAQSLVPRPRLEVTPYAGYMRFGEIVDGPLGVSLSGGDGAIYGAQVAVQLVPGFAIVGNVARADAQLEVGLPFLGGYEIGESSALLYDAGVQLGTSLTGGLLPIAPFLQVGVGGMRTDVRSGPVETDATSVAFNAGIGADLTLSQGIGVRLMAKDYMTKFDAEEATGFDLGTNYSHNWALSAGLTLSF